MESVELIVVVYKEADQAGQVLKSLKKLVKDGSLHLFDAAVLIKDQRGKIRLEETRDVSAGRGSLFGAVVGGLVGFLGGPAGILVGAATGATMGGAIAKKVDLGFSHEFLDQLGKSLKPGCSALLMLIEEPWTEQAVKVLEQQPGTLFRHALKSEILVQIERSQQDP